MAELKDQFFQAIERGDAAHVRKLLCLFPYLKEEELFGLTPLNYAIRLGHTDITLAIGLPARESDLQKLIEIAAPLGHKELLSLLIYYYSKHHPVMRDSPRAFEYNEILQMNVPPSCKYAVYFPYIWARICPLLYVLSKRKVREGERKLKDLPVKPIAKYLY